MEQNIRLGRIAGVPVGINWSILVIFWLLAWELADLVLPGYHPHQARAIYWIAGILATALFFASLLAHEVSHAVVARRNGIGVRRITLWLFGGVSELESEALTPGADFRIAVVGPLTSFVLAGVYGALAFLLPETGGNEAVLVSAIGWLAWVNLLLGGFNLIPAAPLDGGRVLRAALWRRSGNRVRAATTAARTGQAFGYALVVLGVLEFLAVGLVGLWFVFLGWFLLAAARGEESSAVMRGSLVDVHVRDLMTPNPTTFASGTTVADLLDSQLHRHRFSSYPLVGPGGRLEGLTTMGRIRHVPADRRRTTRLIDIACRLSDVPVGKPGEPIPDLLLRMQASSDGRAFVLDEAGHLVGIVSPSDIARFVQLSMLRSK
ncbi:MAG TPA: site-2 protease family protein [Acidimicrobiales bacterium]|nr:site-2 protease family protein [Acidimicrobiales bacterium]